MKRRITLTKSNVRRSLNRLVDWLGRGEIESQLKKVHRRLDTSKGLYRKEWVEPKCLWWIELEKAIETDFKGQSFDGRISEMSCFFETAAKMSTLYSGMSCKKREEFRRRLLTSNDLNPVLIEIDMAAHFWQKGFDLEWAEPSHGKRIPEFTCQNGKLRYDVECKTKTADAGRMIAWSTFYQLADSIIGDLRSRGYHGDVEIVTPSRLPNSREWQLSVVIEMVISEATETELSDGTVIATSLFQEERRVPRKDFGADQTGFQGPLGYAAVDAEEETDTDLLNPVVVRVRSRKDDELSRSISKDLKDARHQLSMKRPGIIMCFIPESKGFDEVTSILDKSIKQFFTHHSTDFIFAVTFVTARETERRYRNVETLFPTMTFLNPRYDEKWGPAKPYMAESF